MFELIDVVIAGVGATAMGLLNYSFIKYDLSKTGEGLGDRQKRRKENLAKTELWEHAAYSIALGIAMFALLVSNATNILSHYSFWPRVAITVVCFWVLFFILRFSLHSLFRHFQSPVKS